MNKPTKADIQEFLRESNAIEGVYDINNLDQATHAWNWLMKQKKMSPSVVLKTHKILMVNQPLMPDERGYFRTVNVMVGKHICMAPVLIREAVEGWSNWMNATPEQVDEGLSQQLHIEYEEIHPFVDGNGRTGRMFMNWWRLKNGLPLLIIHEGVEQKQYYEWFR